MRRSSAQGVKANVLFFDKKPASEIPWTRKLWIYDLRPNMYFTLKINPLRCDDLDEFVTCWFGRNRGAGAVPTDGNRDDWRPTWWEESPDGRWRAYHYPELVARDKASLDILWLKDDSLSDSDNLSAPEVIAMGIVENLEAALEQFREILVGVLPGDSVEGRSV